MLRQTTQTPTARTSWLIILLAWASTALVSIPLPAQTTILEGLGVQGEAWVGMTRREVKAVLGTSYDNRVEKTKISCVDCKNPKTTTRYVRTRNEWTYGQRGITLRFKKNRVISASFANTGYVTSKGLAVGDSLSTIIPAYGRTLLGGYVRYPQLGISFDTDQGLITAIEVFPPVR
ncbi:MAG TPA: hypothetical protein PLN54_06630 [Flavobacteriales bacterium]|nr:hypothetical protein [Flavobacteriales bacterium]